MLPSSGIDAYGRNGSLTPPPSRRGSRRRTLLHIPHTHKHTPHTLDSRARACDDGGDDVSIFLVHFLILSSGNNWHTRDELHDDGLDGWMGYVGIAIAASRSPHGMTCLSL